MNRKPLRNHLIRWSIYYLIQITAIVLIGWLSDKFFVFLIDLCIFTLFNIAFRVVHLLFDLGKIHSETLVNIVVFLFNFELCICFTLSTQVSQHNRIILILGLLRLVSTVRIMRSSIFHLKRYYSEPLTNHCCERYDMVESLTVGLGFQYIFFNMVVLGCMFFYEDDTFNVIERSNLDIAIIGLLLINSSLLYSLYRWLMCKFEVRAIKAVSDISDEDCVYYLHLYHARYDGSGDMFSTFGTSALDQNIMVKTEEAALGRYTDFVSFLPYALIMEALSFKKDFKADKLLLAFKILNYYGHEPLYFSGHDIRSIHEAFITVCNMRTKFKVDEKLHRGIEYDFFHTAFLNCESLKKIKFSKMIDDYIAEKEKFNYSETQNEYVDMVIIELNKLTSRI